jgi:hypothetical protein
MKNPNDGHDLKPLDPKQAAERMAYLSGKIKRPVNVSVWDGTLNGQREHQGPHIAVFQKETLVAPFGPHGDEESEACALLFAYAANFAKGIAGALNDNAPLGEDSSRASDVALIEAIAKRLDATRNALPPDLDGICALACSALTLRTALNRMEVAVHTAYFQARWPHVASIEWTQYWATTDAGSSTLCTDFTATTIRLPNGRLETIPFSGIYDADDLSDEVIGLFTNEAITDENLERLQETATDHLPNEESALDLAQCVMRIDADARRYEFPVPNETAE